MKSNIWGILIFRVSIYIYIFIKLFYLGEDLQLPIIYILGSLALYLGYKVFNNEQSEIFLILDIIFTIIFSYKVHELIFLIFILSVVEINCNKNKKIILATIILILGGIILKSKEYLMEYILIGIISHIIYYREKLLVERSMFLEEKNDEYRNEIYLINRKLYNEKSVREQYVYTEKMEERNNLSITMHDKVGHTLAAALMQLEATKIVLSKDLIKGIDMIDNTINVLSNGMNEIRSTLREVKPLPEEMGINRLKLLIEEKIKNTRFKYSLIYKGDLEKITLKQWHILLDATREFSTNTLKYSDGSKFFINIEVMNKILRFSFKDNGQGTSKYKKGIGVIGIEEKVENESGNFIINSLNGFQIIITLPIKE